MSCIDEMSARCVEAVPGSHVPSWIHRPCPLCGSNERDLLFRDRNRREGYPVETDLVACTACGMRYLSPVPVSEQWLDEYSNLYKPARGPRGLPSLVVRRLDTALFIWTDLWSHHTGWHEAPFGPGGGRRILDIGCGSGVKLKTFERREFEVYGIDVAPEAIADARRLIGGTFYVGAIETTELPDAFFDFIRFDNVLEHIYQPRPFLEKVYRLLKPGGGAYGYVPNGLSPTMQLMGKYSISSWVPFHINLFTPSCLRALATGVGFNAEVRGISYPHWVMQSVRQWRNRDRPNFDETVMDWVDRFVRAGAAPLWWLFNKVWQGEELMLIAHKPQEGLT